MKYPVYNIEGKETDSVLLPEDIFEVEMNDDLVHQVMVLQSSNRRQNTADTKDRAETRGGGKKPWRQKGTGRARHGSSRSPIWKGGGVTFGPTDERNYKKKINKKTKKKALYMVLSSKAKNRSLYIIDSFDSIVPKTKEMAKVLKNLKIEKSVIVAPLSNNETVFRACRNIPGVLIMPILDLNVLDLLSFKDLILTKDGIKNIKKNSVK